MSHTLYDAMKHTQNPWATLLLKQVATSDMSFSVLPFVPKDGESFSYEREVSLGSFSFIAPGGSVASTTGTTERVDITKREASEDFWVDSFAADNQSGQVNPRDRQTMMKIKAAGRALAGKHITGGSITSATVDAFDSGAYVDALVAASPYIRDRLEAGELRYTHSGTLLQFRAPGDRDFGTAVACALDGTYTLYSSSPSKWIKVTLDVSDATVNQTKRITFTASNEFDGLTKHVSPAQTRPSSGTDGDALSFAIMEELLDAVKNRGGQLAFVGHSKLRRKFNTLLRATGGAGPAFVMQDGSMAPTFDGVPFLTNDFVPTNEAKGSASTLSSLYLVNYEPEIGVYMGALGGGPTMNVKADPRDANVLGFRLRDLGTNQTTSTVGTRLSWYGGLACGSDYSLAVAREIITV